MRSCMGSARRPSDGGRRVSPRRSTVRRHVDRSIGLRPSAHDRPCWSPDVDRKALNLIVDGNEGVKAIAATSSEAELKAVTEKATEVLVAENVEPYAVGPAIESGSVSVQVPASRVEDLTPKLATALNGVTRGLVADVVQRLRRTGVPLSEVLTVPGRF